MHRQWTRASSACEWALLLRTAEYEPLQHLELAYFVCQWKIEENVAA